MLYFVESSFGGGSFSKKLHIHMNFLSIEHIEDFSK